MAIIKRSVSTIKPIELENYAETKVNILHKESKEESKEDQPKEDKESKAKNEESKAKNEESQEKEKD